MPLRPPGVCASHQSAVFLNVHVPKSAGSSTECTLSSDAHWGWPLAIEEVQSARSAVSLRQIGNHGTFQDFMNGYPKGPLMPIGRCPGHLWAPGGRDCSAPPHGGPPAACTPLVTWLQNPTTRFLSAFYHYYGTGERRDCGFLQCREGSELARRYMGGQITPSEFALWEPASDFEEGLNK